MTFIVGAAAHGSPGVSTAFQLVASLWPASDAVPVVVEADVTGGVLAARYELSLTPGFVTLAESLRKFESPKLLDHAQRMPSGVACVAISPSATAASAQLRSAGPYLGPYLAQSGHPVLLDAGTMTPDGKTVPSVTAADLLLWFVRPTREELLVLRHRLAECPQPENVGIVLVGDTPYNAEQVQDAMEVEVLHTLPIDRRGAVAANLGGDDRFLRRSQIARSCTNLAELIQERFAVKRTAAATSSDAAAKSVTAPKQPKAPNAPVDDESGPTTDAASASAPPPPDAPPPPRPPAPPPPPPPSAPADKAQAIDFDEEELEVWQPKSAAADADPSPDDEPGLVVWVNDAQ